MKKLLPVTIIFVVLLISLPTFAEYGKDWVCVTPSAPWGPRTGHSAVVYDGKIWVMGGGNVSGLKCDVWCSSDGRNWTQVTSSASFGTRVFQTALVYQDKIWMLFGGDPLGGEPSVMSSSDGINWTEVSSRPELSIYSHTSVVFAGKMWVIGGYQFGEISDKVYSSTDGITWIQEMSIPDPRANHSSVVYDGDIWIMGGWISDPVQPGFTYANDVLRSGVQVTSAAPWTARYFHCSVACDGRVWIAGGAGDSIHVMNDVWSSPDGATWTEATDSAPWSERNMHTMVVFKDKIWVLGGSYSGDYKGDVWCSGPGSVLDVPAEYSTIQSAIDAATDGDTINIAANVYYEVLNVTKSLTLQGAGAGDTIIDSSGAEIALKGRVPDIGLFDLTIRNASCAVQLFQSDRARIEGCVIGPLDGKDGTFNTEEDGETVYGICIYNSENCVIRNNSFTQLIGGTGASLWSVRWGRDGGSAYAIRLSSATACQIISNSIDDIQGGNGGYVFTSTVSDYYGGDGGSGGHAYGVYCADALINGVIENNQLANISGGSGSAGSMGYMDSGNGGSGGDSFAVYVAGNIQAGRISGNRFSTIHGGGGSSGGGPARISGSGGDGGEAGGIVSGMTFKQCELTNNLIQDLVGGNGGSGSSGIAGISASGRCGDALGISGKSTGSLFAHNTIGNLTGGSRGDSSYGLDGSALCIQLAKGTSDRYLNNIFFSTRRGSIITDEDVTAAGLSVASASACVANFNCYYDHEISNVEGISMGPGSFEADPLLESDFSLMADSPSIDAGGWVPEVTCDIDGATRPMDAASGSLGDGSDYDIGAFEYPGDSQEEPYPTFTPTQTPTITPTPTDGPTQTPTPAYTGPENYIAELPGGVTMEFLHVSPGTFLMGGDPYDVGWTYENELPRHEVEIGYHFYLGKYEVSQPQWLALMGEWPGGEPDFLVGDDVPAYNISWEDCQDYLDAMNNYLSGHYRLPSEAEWEYACRAGTTTRYYFGNDAGVSDGDTYVLDTSLPNKISVGPGYMGRKNPNPWGFHDILGNFGEWCQDSFHNTYTGAPTDGSVWFNSAAGSRVVRADYLLGYKARTYRCAMRNNISKDFRDDRIGFRILLEAPLVEAATPYGDVDGDGAVDFRDPFLFAPYWQEPSDDSETSYRCNPILDTQIDERDLLWLLNRW